MHHRLCVVMRQRRKRGSSRRLTPLGCRCRWWHGDMGSRRTNCSAGGGFLQANSRSVGNREAGSLPRVGRFCVRRRGRLLDRRRGRGHFGRGRRSLVAESRGRSCSRSGKGRLAMSLAVILCDKGAPLRKAALVPSNDPLCRKYLSIPDQHPCRAHESEHFYSVRNLYGT
jgi:hypothetical protein